MKQYTAKSVLDSSSQSTIARVVKEHWLHFASERTLLPILSVSIIAEGYTRLIRRFLPFAYNAVAAEFVQGRTLFLLNEPDVARRTGRLLQKLGARRFLTHILRPAHRAGMDAVRSILHRRQRAALDAASVVRTMLDAYPTFMAAIGVYNCLNRFAVLQGTLPFAPSVTKRIGKQRDTLGAQYPRIEELLNRSLAQPGRVAHADGDLLRWMTKTELLAWLAQGKKLSTADRITLRQRKVLSFSLFVAKPFTEQVTTKKQFIASLERRLLHPQPDTTVLHGQPTYPGHVRGRVVVLQGNRRQSSRARILVTSMTHPKDMALIRGCLAIVTNEGGVLSHAAVLARERKIPCIVGTKVATRMFKDGDLVEVDAEKGTVKKLS